LGGLAPPGSYAPAFGVWNFWFFKPCFLLLISQTLLV
jgi:hypothetical protein